MDAPVHQPDLWMQDHTADDTAAPARVGSWRCDSCCANLECKRSCEHDNVAATNACNLRSYAWLGSLRTCTLRREGALNM
jgi:hypothetical protein